MTLKMKKANATLAARLRKLARDYEIGKVCGFTCNRIATHIETDVRHRYAEAFGFDEIEFGGTGLEPGCNEDVLWKMKESAMHDTRIMLLCMAAAMAETGDL